MHACAVVGKSFAKKEEEQTTNMMAEMFEAVWGAQFIDSHGDYARACACAFSFEAILRMRGCK